MDRQIKEHQLKTRLSIIQGGKDKLVSPKNVRYVRKNWEHNFSEITILELPEEGHFLPWRQSELVIGEIRRLSRDAVRL